MRKLILCVSVILALLVELSDSRFLCCQLYQQDPIDVKFLKDYKIQKDTGPCYKKAIIFKTWKNRLSCADPNKKWVKKAMKIVPEKR